MAEAHWYGNFEIHQGGEATAILEFTFGRWKTLCLPPVGYKNPRFFGTFSRSSDMLLELLSDWIDNQEIFRVAETTWRIDRNNYRVWESADSMEVSWIP